MPFPERLRALRLDRGFTQEALAKAARLNRMQIRRYENGHSQPMLDALQNIARALRCSLDELAFDETEHTTKRATVLYQLEAVEQLPEEVQEEISRTLEALISWHERKKQKS